MGEVLIEMQGAVAVLTLAAPPMNALDRAMVRSLAARIAHCAGDDGVGAVVLRGSGTRSFSVGSDLAELAAIIASGPDAMAAKFQQDEEVFGALAALGKPTLAAIEGAAVGGGLELAVCCDAVVAGSGARLALPEILLGAFPGSGGTVRVTRRIGAARAKSLMLLGDPVGTEKALAWGLLDECVPDGEAFGRAMQIATRLAAGPRRAIAACKASIDAATTMEPEAALAVARGLAVELAFSDDVKEGLAAFLEKRRPVFGLPAVDSARP